jgi:hypothetical protein|nr:MAG TPA: hypothetical protein [Crassvirales sp.]
MCLYLRNKVERIATSNIYVWKALVNYDGHGYYSPVFNYRYDIGKTYESELNESGNGISISKGLHSFGYNINILSSYAGEYECYGSSYNCFDIKEPINTIGLFIIPEGSYYYTDGYFYASDTLKLLRTLPINEFFNYMMNR